MKKESLLNKFVKDKREERKKKKHRKKEKNIDNEDLQEFAEELFK